MEFIFLTICYLVVLNAIVSKNKIKKANIAEQAMLAINGMISASEAAEKAHGAMIEQKNREFEAAYNEYKITKGLNEPIRTTHSKMA